MLFSYITESSPSDTSLNPLSYHIVIHLPLIHHCVIPPLWNITCYLPPPPPPPPRYSTESSPLSFLSSLSLWYITVSSLVHFVSSSHPSPRSLSSLCHFPHWCIAVSPHLSGASLVSVSSSLSSTSLFHGTSMHVCHLDGKSIRLFACQISYCKVICTWYVSNIRNSS